MKELIKKIVLYVIGISSWISLVFACLSMSYLIPSLTIQDIVTAPIFNAILYLIFGSLFWALMVSCLAGLSRFFVEVTSKFISCVDVVIFLSAIVCAIALLIMVWELVVFDCYDSTLNVVMAVWVTIGIISAYSILLFNIGKGILIGFGVIEKNKKIENNS